MVTGLLIGRRWGEEGVRKWYTGPTDILANR